MDKVTDESWNMINILNLQSPFITTHIDLSGFTGLRISVGGFEGLASVQEVTLPPNIKGIDSRAFRGCGQLKRVHMPALLERIGERAFENCVSLVDVKMPPRLRIIDSKAFANNTSLRHVDLRHCHELWSIYTEAFRGCTNLENAQFPLKPMGRIGTWAFKGCKRLGPVVYLPGSLLFIGDAFGDCESLVHVVANHIEICGENKGRRFGLPRYSAISAPEKVAEKFHGVVANQNPEMLLTYYWKSPRRHSELRFPPLAIAFLIFVLQRTTAAPNVPFEIITSGILSFLNCIDLAQCQSSLTRKPAGCSTTTTPTPSPPSFTAYVPTTPTQKRSKGSTKRPAEPCNRRKSKKRRDI
tara:strand:- start:1832 stop:2896 length:1065 start_codon:yes stop_codon:yes gene_type:complete